MVVIIITHVLNKYSIFTLNITRPFEINLTQGNAIFILVEPG